MTNQAWIPASVRPPKGVNILICDANGWMDVVSTKPRRYADGRVLNWKAAWKFGNFTRIVAWMPLPPFPKGLCNKTANGEMP